MTTLTRDDYIQLIEQAYFGNVVKTNIDAVLDCFTDECLTTIRHGDNPLRLFRKHPSANEMPLREFYAHLCGNFDTSFDNFTHYIDAEIGQCASTFIVSLTPKHDSDYLSAGPQTLNNCNFFSYEDGRIKEMTIYYSNTEAKTISNTSNSTPTGYPK
ncbi:MAG: hypothetical protein ACI909_003225 [Planctomycetota bacterium]